MERNRSTDNRVRNSANTMQFGRDIEVSLRQLIYDGGYMKQQSKADLGLYESQRYLQMGMIERRAVDLVEVYLDIIRAKRQIAMAQSHIADHEELLKKFRVREQGGDVRTNTELIEGRLNLARNDLDLQKTALEEAEARFKRLVGADSGKLTVPEIPAAVDGKPKIWDYMAAQSAFSAAVSRAESQDGTRKPQVYLDMGATRGQDTGGYAGRNDEHHALLTMSWDLFKGGSNVARRRSHDHMAREALLLIDAARDQNEYELRLLKEELRAAEAAQKSFNQYSERLGKVIIDYDRQFDLGMQKLIDLLDIRQEKYDADVQRIDADFRVIGSRARILGNQGQLVHCLVGDFVEKKLRMCRDHSEKWQCDRVYQPATHCSPLPLSQNINTSRRTNDDCPSDLKCSSQSRCGKPECDECGGKKQLTSLRATPVESDRLKGANLFRFLSRKK